MRTRASSRTASTIHRHNVVAERYGLLSEIASEIESGENSPHHITAREWLEAPGA
jgi:GTP cyclohydrolase I/GTP cyclohydrolase-4